jgi:hypothetical protein
MLPAIRFSRFRVALAAGALFTAVIELLLLVVPFNSLVSLRLVLPLNGPGMQILWFLLTIFYSVFPRDPFVRTGVPHLHLQLTLVNFVFYSVCFYLVMTIWTWIRTALRNQEHAET